MKRFTFLEWLIVFGKEWLLPKGGLALAVYGVCSVLFSLDSDTKMTEAAVKRFSGLFQTTGSIYYEAALIAIAILWLVALLCEGVSRWRKQKGVVFLLGRKGRLLATGFLTLLGFLATPLVVAFAFAYVYTSVDPAFKVTIAVYAAAFVFMSAGLHLMSFSDAHALHSITYVIDVPADFRGDLRKATLSKVSEHLGKIIWIESPHLFVETTDGQIVLSVPVHLEATKWSKDDLKILMNGLTRIEESWGESGFAWRREISADLLKRMPRNVGV